MAERIQVELVDDVDGSPAQQTVTFALDGVTYEIDLSERNAQALRSALARYIEQGRRVTGTAAPAAAKSSRKQEREERQTRQANRALTEEIRGAAQRTKERLSKQAEQRAAEQTEAPSAPEKEEQPLVVANGAGAARPAEPKRTKEKEAPVAAPAVSLPKFSSAQD